MTTSTGTTSTGASPPRRAARHLLFAGAALIAVAAAWTWFEGRRFVARPFQPSERRLVEQAIATWTAFGFDGDTVACRRLAGMLQRGEIEAMDERSFARKQERITLGYTDENGRILLNPSICFAALNALGPSREHGAHGGDLVRTMSTLYHEWQHYYLSSSEEAAYRAEWQFVERCIAALREKRPSSPLLPELEEWAREMPGRVEVYTRK